MKEITMRYGVIAKSKVYHFLDARENFPATFCGLGLYEDKDETTNKRPCNRTLCRKCKRIKK